VRTGEASLWVIATTGAHRIRGRNGEKSAGIGGQRRGGMRGGRGTPVGSATSRSVARDRSRGRKHGQEATPEQEGSALPLALHAPSATPEKKPEEMNHAQLSEAGIELLAIPAVLRPTTHEPRKSTRAEPSRAAVGSRPPVSTNGIARWVGPMAGRSAEIGGRGMEL